MLLTILFYYSFQQTCSGDTADKEPPIEAVFTSSIDNWSRGYDVFLDPSLTSIYFSVRRQVIGYPDLFFSIVKTNRDLELDTFKSYNRNIVQKALVLDGDGRTFFAPISDTGTIMEIVTEYLEIQGSYVIPNIKITTGMKLVTTNDFIFIS